MKAARPVFLVLLAGIGAVAALLGCPSPGSSQEVGPPLRVFIDCDNSYCDFDHFRREIMFVDYMRDRQDADVHVLITTRETASGGTEFLLEYIGAGAFETVADSLRTFSSDTDVFDEVRAGLTTMLELGLVRYAARLPTAHRLDVTYDAPDTTGLTRGAVDDPWNYWIFRIRVGGDIAGEERQSVFSANGALSANRTTKDWKIRLFASGWYSEDSFELSDGTQFESIARELGSGAFFARSLGDHWGLGLDTEARVSTFLNYDLALAAGPAVEYNIFPYAQSSRREFTFTYRVGVNYFDYEEVTIFDKLEETRPSNSLEISYSVRQPFGSINTSLLGFMYLDDRSQHRFVFSAWFNVRIVRGLELNLSGSAQRLKDQINLPRGGATDEEVLLRRQELGTDYRYSLGVSLSYTFGSIFNNVVNPRFE
jgi:hypothetical protein